jgi:hypothetical protein
MRWLGLSMVMLLASSAQAGVQDAKCNAFLEYGKFSDDRMVMLVSGLRDGFAIGLVFGSMIEAGGMTETVDEWVGWIIGQKGDTLALMLRDQCEKAPGASMGEAFGQLMVDQGRERGLIPLALPRVPDINL